MRTARSRRHGAAPTVLSVYVGLLAATVTGVAWAGGLHRYLDGYCTRRGVFGSVDGDLSGLTAVQCAYDRGAPVVVPDLLPLMWSVAVLVTGVVVTALVTLLARRWA